VPIATLRVKVNPSKNRFAFVSGCPKLESRSKLVSVDKVKLCCYFIGTFVLADILSIWRRQVKYLKVCFIEDKVKYSEFVGLISVKVVPHNLKTAKSLAGNSSIVV
jgi:hypothetical protein